MKTLMIIDVHKEFAKVLARVMNSTEGDYVIQQVKSGKDAIKQIEANPDAIDMILLGLEEEKGVSSGLKYARYIRKFHPEIQILACSMYTTGALINRVQKLNLHGYIDKGASMEEFILALGKLSKSEVYFSAKHRQLVKEYFEMLKNRKAPFLSTEEWALIQLLKRGLSFDAIAKELKRNTEWIDMQFRYLLNKFQVTTRWDLILATEKK